MVPTEQDSLQPPTGPPLSTISSRSSLRRRPSLLPLSGVARLERREKRIRRLMLGEWSFSCCFTVQSLSLLTRVISRSLRLLPQYGLVSAAELHCLRHTSLTTCTIPLLLQLPVTLALISSALSKPPSRRPRASSPLSSRLDPSSTPLHR